ncbi:endospore germination permease [Paenibacillus koleovorans]|uniref:endospore germination permease n=1 Tax=Paenibacillus koleovorans TaxID=121608 RepID=UPI0013E3C3EF|nr:endospore germination permease [Paenibacillus koleovorans]
MLQASMLLIMAIGLDNHVTVIPLLLNTAQKDSWMSVILVAPLCILWTLLPYSIIRKTEQTNIMTWLRSHNYNLLPPVIALVVFPFFFINAFITLKEVIVWTEVSYLPQTPMLATTLTLLALCVYSALKGIRSIAIIAGLLLPFVWLLGYFVMAANFQVKRYDLLFPVFRTAGFSGIASCMLYAASSFVEVFIIIFMQHSIRDKIRWYHLMILVFLLAGLTVGPLTGAIAAFGYEAVLIRYPTFEQWKLVRIGDYVSHVDFLSIYQWLSGAFVRISLMLYMTAELFKKGKDTKSVRAVPILLLAGALLVLACLPAINDFDYLKLAKWYYMGSFIIIITVSTVLFAIIMWINRKKGANI